MYPFVRMAYQIWRHRNDGSLGVDETHVSHHICWPWDLDFMMELNNGRSLTLYDLGRIPYAKRIGLLDVLKKNDWTMAMAGATVRWRRRVRMFQKLKMHTHFLGRDARFIYMLQTLWHGEHPTSSIVYRIAIANKDGIIPTDKVAAQLPDGYAVEKVLPEWVQKWIDAENARTWPPEF